jgi:DMSO/TMAO reductase YedYZ molybdopterin-dependent catalytic subunit
MDISRRKFLQLISAGSGLMLWTDCQRWTGLKWFISDGIKHDDWELEVDGLVKNPQRYSMADLRTLSGSQRKVPMGQILVSLILAQVKPLKRARYVVLHCVDRIVCIDIVTAYTDSTMLVYGDIATNIQRFELSYKAKG